MKHCSEEDMATHKYKHLTTYHYHYSLKTQMKTHSERFKEHLKAPSPIYDHYNTTGHNVTLDNFSIVGMEGQNLCRWIKEALYTRENNPSLNKNIGKYHLPHIWDEVLHNTSELKLNIHLPPGNNIYQEGTLTLQWPFHLPLGNNICHHKYTKCGYSICHRAITSAPYSIENK